MSCYQKKDQTSTLVKVFRQPNKRSIHKVTKVVYSLLHAVVCNLHLFNEQSPEVVAISLVLAARSYYKIQASSTLHTEFIFGRMVEPVMLTNAKLI